MHSRQHSLVTVNPHHHSLCTTVPRQTSSARLAVASCQATPPLHNTRCLRAASVAPPPIASRCSPCAGRRAHAARRLAASPVRRWARHYVAHPCHHPVRHLAAWSVVARARLAAALSPKASWTRRMATIHHVHLQHRQILLQTGHYWDGRQDNHRLGQGHVATSGQRQHPEAVVCLRAG